jgi:hypothetical protein
MDSHVLKQGWLSWSAGQSFNWAGQQILGGPPQNVGWAMALLPPKPAMRRHH